VPDKNLGAADFDAEEVHIHEGRLRVDDEFLVLMYTTLPSSRSLAVVGWWRLVGWWVVVVAGGCASLMMTGMLECRSDGVYNAFKEGNDGVVRYVRERLAAREGSASVAAQLVRHARQLEDAVASPERCLLPHARTHAPLLPLQVGWRVVLERRTDGK
jgi:hypothetical protein